MIEQLFGSSTPAWPVLPSPGFGWPQVPAGLGARALSSPWPTFIAPDIVTTTTVRALLEAVAMRRGQPLGPTNDQECEDFIYDALEMIPAAGEVEVRCEGARVTLTGSVQHKRLKHDVGEIAWAIPGVNDVQNNIAIVPRRRVRTSGRDEPSVPQSSRKPA